jgi:hypothetical protein
MKRQINEIKKMQRLAGLITESEYQESMMSKDTLSDDDIVKKLSDHVTNSELYKSDFNEWENNLFDNDDAKPFDYFVRNWTVLDGEQSRHEDEANKDINYWMNEYSVNEEIANLMKQLVDSNYSGK